MAPTPSTPPSAVDREVLELANDLRPVLLHLARQLRREVNPLGITAGQASLLASIHGSPGIGVNDLATREGSSAPSICAHVDRLEQAGLVERTRAEQGDRRRVGLSVTAEGERVLRAARSRRTAWLAQQLAHLDPAQRSSLRSAMTALQEVAVQVQGAPR